MNTLKPLPSIFVHERLSSRATEQGFSTTSHVVIRGIVPPQFDLMKRLKMMKSVLQKSSNKNQQAWYDIYRIIYIQRWFSYGDATPHLPRYIAYPAYHTQAGSCRNHLSVGREYVTGEAMVAISFDICSQFFQLASYLQDMYRKILLGKAAASSAICSCVFCSWVLNTM